jgi:hypothetical protein
MNNMKQILTEWRQYIKEHSVSPGFYPPQFSAMISKLKDLAQHNWIFFDTETTGLPLRDGTVPDHVQLTQLAAIAYQTNNLDSIPTQVNNGMFNVKILLMPVTEREIEREQAEIEAGTYQGNPKFSISGLLSMNDYHGGEKVPRVDQKTGANMFNQYIQQQKNASPSGKLVFWAHNSPFDAKMTNLFYQRGGISSPDIAIMDSIAIIDNYLKAVLQYLQKNKNKMNDEDKHIIQSITAISRKGKPYLASKLGLMASAFEIDNASWHEATADIGMTMEVLYKTLQYLLDPDRGGRFAIDKLEPKYRYNRE